MDFLIFLDGKESIDRVADQVRIVHSASPRLHVVSMQPSRAESLKALPGVIELTTGTFSPEVMEQLDSQERFFLEAFTSRTDSKQRKGEGLPWDAPGFEPPDPPVEAAKDAARAETDSPGAGTSKGDREHE